MDVYKNEVAMLQQRLADSMVANDLLRTRLEEMADFLEEVLSMSQTSLMNLSNWSAHKRQALQRSILQSRELSRSLSQSLMSGIDANDTCNNIVAVPDNNNSPVEPINQIQLDNDKLTKVCSFFFNVDAEFLCMSSCSRFEVMDLVLMNRPPFHPFEMLLLLEFI